MLAPSPPPPLPAPRGPISAWLVQTFGRAPDAELPPAPADPTDDPVLGEDAPLALYLCYELHYRGFDGVDERWEWHPDLLRVRHDLERRFEARLRELVGSTPNTDDVVAWLQERLAQQQGPSISTWLEEHLDLERVREDAVLRSAYQLKEADPHSWMIPRLWGRPKAALVEIQAEEYGDGVEKDMHSGLFGLTMSRLGLDPSYGAYLDQIPGVALSPVNLISLFGLHRRLRGALVGHLAAFEMTSVPLMSRYTNLLRDLGFDSWTRLFYDTHIVADSHHQTVAAHGLVAGLLEQEPGVASDVLFGVLALEQVEGALARRVLGCWTEGRSALLRPLPGGLPTPGRGDGPPPAADPRLDDPPATPLAG